MRRPNCDRLIADRAHRPRMQFHSEYVAAENASAFFPMLEAAASNPLPTDPQQLAKKVVSMIEERGFLSSGAPRTLYRMALSLHTDAPAVQAYYHLYETTVVPTFKQGKKEFKADCPFWVDWRNEQHCSFESFKRVIGSKSRFVVGPGTAMACLMLIRCLQLGSPRNLPL